MNKIIKQTYYVEVTDDRVDLDPPYIWQSEVLDTEKAAVVLGRNIAAGFSRSDIRPLVQSGDYLNPQWIKSVQGAKHHLHVYVMVMEWYSEDGYDINQLEQVK